MATHYSIFAWSSPWTEEPSGLQDYPVLRHMQLYFLLKIPFRFQSGSYCLV